MTTRLNLLSFLPIMAFLSVSGAAIIAEPNNTEACAGEDLLLNWLFTNETELNAAVWLKGTTQLATRIGSTDAVVVDEFKDKVVYIGNGLIELLKLNITDEGIYQLAVSYQPGSRLPRDVSSVNVVVKDPPGIPRLENSSDSKEYTCSVSYTGKPAADVQIKVGGRLQFSNTANVTQGQKVECCVTGNAVVCLSDNGDKAKTYCISVAGDETESITLQYITGSTEPSVTINFKVVVAGGIAIGIFALFAVVVLVCFCCMKRHC